MKTHAIIHVDTQAFLSWEFTGASVHDTLVFPTLLERIDFRLGDFYADSGYLSSLNVQLISGRGGTPYIRPKKTTKGRPPPKTKDPPGHRSGEAFRVMVDAYKKDETAWLKTYFTRNTIESAWSGVKRRFNGLLHAASDKTRRVEAALKLVVWNITRLTRVRKRN